MKKTVRHEYQIPTQSLSGYGKAKAVLEATEPLKHLSRYGWTEVGGVIRVWWETQE